VCTGGVGPTGDDLTREGIAAFLGEEPSVDAALLETVRAFFAARGQEMPERNAKQAWLIPSAEALTNPVGTAPGWFVRHGDHRIVAMPGVPREMFRMWRDQALPRIRESLTGKVFASVTFKTLGIGESAAEQELADLVALPDPVVATYAKDDGVHVRVTARATDGPSAEAARDRAAAEVCRRLGRYIYATGDSTLAGVIAGQLLSTGRRLAIVESGAGARLTGIITGDPGASALLDQAIAHVAGDGIGTTWTASSLASQVTSGEGVVVIALTVAAQPDGPGVFTATAMIAVRGPVHADEEMTLRASYPEVQRRAALAAADLLRRTLAGPS
ncbi:MAG: molybdopterin-binding protein, partial [Chloroflexota bacterium]|nr:molybdopterin-binding protein [Chloroflexota bacterium]